MDKKNNTISEAAIRIISRYGLRKTTMSDLAEEAGVSRQTLYNSYCNKDEVVRAAIRFSTDCGIEAVNAGWAKDQTLGQKLDRFFEIGPVSWFDLIQSSPDAADLIDGLNAAGSDELTQGACRWTQAIADILAHHDGDLSRIGMTTPDLADFIYSASSSAKYSAKSRAQLLRRLETLKASVLALVGEAN